MKVDNFKRQDGVCVLSIRNPPVNSLHPNILQQLMQEIADAERDTQVRGIVLTGANHYFSAGFDVTQFANPSEAGKKWMGNAVNKKLNSQVEQCSKPIVAALENTCLGGGCEIAMACNGRVGTPNLKIGLPELQLGIIPGFGGTQRMPRLIGVQHAVQAMLTSKPFKAERALQLGLIDAVVPPQQLIDAAAELVGKIASGAVPRLCALTRTDRLESYEQVLNIIKFAKEQTKRKAPGLQHPLLCLDAILAGVEKGGYEGLVKEKEMFDLCRTLDTHKGLLHLFLSQRQTKRVRGVTDTGLVPRQFNTVAVLGGGLMGSGIATALLQAGCSVILKEINQKLAEAGQKRIMDNMKGLVSKGRMSQRDAQACGSRLTLAIDYANFGSVDMVIEAAIENLAIKQKIFADLVKACRPDCVLSTNTSTIDITAVGANSGALDRVVGAHFFSPAHLMPLLEIVRSKHTAPQVVLDCIALAGRIRKTPVVVGNCTGFCVNRVFFPYNMAGTLLADIGVNPYIVDKALFGFGMPMGVFRLMDLVGADVAMHVGKNFVESFPERAYVSPLLPIINQSGRLGEKVGKGWYNYKNSRKGVPDPDAMKQVMQSRKEAGRGSEEVKLSPQEIVETLMFPTVNEACRCIAEGIVDKPSDLDVATVLGMGFPPPKGGLICWADMVGAQHIVQRLDYFASKYGRELQSFFEPCAYLRYCADNKRKLGQGVVGLPSRM